MKLQTIKFSLLLGIVIASMPYNNIKDDSINTAIRANAYLGDGTTEELFDDLSQNINNETYTNKYAAYYFSNLRDNFANNVFGSCGYVSIGMLLSFYDAYWDDSIVSNEYDVTSNFSTSHDIGADFYLVPSDTTSPGIRFESSSLFDDYDIDDYLSYASSNQNTYFQFKLFELSKNCFNYISNNDLSLSSEDIYQLLDYYFHTYKNYSNTQIVVDLYANSNQTTLKKNVIANILSGIPSILTVKNPTTLDTHTVVAYDYDPSTTEIYVHTGWKDETTNTALTHVSLSDLGYTQIVTRICLQINTSKNLGNKYYSLSNEGYNASTFILPREIELVDGNYADMVPTFSWKSLYNEAWTNETYYFNLSVLTIKGVEVFTASNITTNSYTFTTSQWEQARFNTSGKRYYVYVSIESNSSSLDDYWVRQQFTKPNTYQNVPYIMPSEYGFADAYPVDNTTKEQYITHNVRGFEFQTRRYRTGYIHNEDIVMSPSKLGITEAFIEYKFDVAIDRIDVELSHWREQSVEWLTSSNGTAVLQQYIGTGWVTVLDLLSDDTDLPRDRTNKTVYKIEFPQKAYKIRFYSSYSGVSDSRNRGRICIGNMAFYQSEYSLPLSGGELDYDPDAWESCKGETNCYAYALNVMHNPYPFPNSQYYTLQPGTSDDMYHPYNENYNTKSYMQQMIYLDSINYNFTLKEIDKDEKCSPNSYKIALAVAPGSDYHFYRQNSDGSWSHKPGTTSVRVVDYLDEIIYDPETCDRRSPDGSINYSVFCGFYEVNVNSINVDIY